jgi:hypothetical protein
VSVCSSESRGTISKHNLRSRMKPTTKVNLLMLIGSTFILLNVFARPLGIPRGYDCIPTLLAVVFIYLGYRASKKAKATGQIPEQSDVQKRTRFSVMVVTLGATCVTMPFVMPWTTGVALPFGEWVVISIFTFFMCIGILWLTMKMKK